MAFKFVFLCAMAAVASAGVLPHQEHAIYAHQPQLIKTIAAPTYVKHVEYEHEQPAHYDFSYSVHDGHSGDIKSQQESRKGDSVQGSYSLIEADGLHRRVVDYTADAHHGFNAQVRHEPIGHKVHAAPVAVHHATPVAVHHAAPVAVHHAVPVAVHHAAPVAYQHSSVHQHGAPLAIQHHAAPFAYQQSSIQHHTAPLAVHHSAPLAIHHAAPLAIHHAAPVAHYSANHGLSSQVVHHDSHNDYHHHY